DAPGVLPFSRVQTLGVGRTAAHEPCAVAIAAAARQGPAGPACRAAQWFSAGHRRVLDHRLETIPVRSILYNVRGEVGLIGVRGDVNDWSCSRDLHHLRCGANL